LGSGVVTGPSRHQAGDEGAKQGFAASASVVHAAVAERHPDAAIIVPPPSTAMPSDTAQTNPTQRDRHLHGITNNGRAGWQKSSGYNKRSRVEAAIDRFKQVIGNGLHSQTDARQNAEIAVAVHVPGCWSLDARPPSASCEAQQEVGPSPGVGALSRSRG